MDSARRCFPPERFEAKLFEGFRLVAEELLAGREPGMDTLFKAGLGSLLADRRANPIELLSDQKNSLPFLQTAA